MNLDAYVRMGCLIGVLAFAAGCSSARQQRYSQRSFSATSLVTAKRVTERLSNASDIPRKIAAVNDETHPMRAADSEQSIQPSAFTQVTDGEVDRQSLDAANPAITPDELPQSPTEGERADQPLIGATLDQAINTCLLANPTLRAGFEAINQAQGDFLTSSLKPNPTLFTDVQLLPLTRSFTVTNQGGPPQQDVVTTYPIDWFLFGKRAAAMASTSHGVRVAEAVYADLVRQLTAETAFAFYDVLEAQSRCSMWHARIPRV